jgi:hypothetical protein
MTIKKRSSGTVGIDATGPVEGVTQRALDVLGTYVF